MKKLIALLWAVPVMLWASAGVSHLDKAAVSLNDKASQLRGLKHFTTYCQSCHDAGFVRYTHLSALGMPDADIKAMMPQNGKLTDGIHAAMAKKDAKTAFGVAPPDLSLITRSRGADWLYTYMRGFYVDTTRPSGWNNVVFDKVAMPHVLAGFEGTKTLQKKPDGSVAFQVQSAGSMSSKEYDAMVLDLVNFLASAGEPHQAKRLALGPWVLLALLALLVLFYLLKKEYWKDVK